MRTKIWIPVLLVVVAAVAFVVGWQFQGEPEPPEETEVADLPPPPEPTPLLEEQEPEPPPAPAPAPRPARRPARRSPEPEPPPAATPPPSQPAPAARAESGVRRVETTRVRVAEGTKILFTLNDSLSTKDNRQGDPFSGVVSRSVRVGEKTVIPEGSVVRGTVARVERAGRVKGRAELGLRFDELELPSGQVYDLSASLTQLDESEKEGVTEEGQVEGEGTKKRDAATIGGGGGIGAAIGAIAGGGGKGAATGAAVGAGAGAAVVLLTRGKDVELKRGSELAVQLNRPLTIEVK